jgi:NADH-quinone oxidoreductase subunit N
MYLDETIVTFPKLRQPVEGGLIFLMALLVSPIGYFLIGPLGNFADRAAGALF